MLDTVQRELRYGIAIRRDDGTEFLAHGSPCGPVLFHRLKPARQYKRDLRPHFKCRVVKLEVSIKEVKP